MQIAGVSATAFILSCSCRRKDAAASPKAPRSLAGEALRNTKRHVLGLPLALSRSVLEHFACRQCDCAGASLFLLYGALSFPLQANLFHDGSTAAQHAC